MSDALTDANLTIRRLRKELQRWAVKRRNLTQQALDAQKASRVSRQDCHALKREIALAKHHTDKYVAMRERAEKAERAWSALGVEIEEIFQSSDPDCAAYFVGIDIRRRIRRALACEEES